MLSGLLVVLLLCIQSQGLIAQELKAGDSRAGYEREDFVTRSQRLDTMRVYPVDLHQLAANPPLGLPPFPAEVPDPAVIDLGRRLFFDRRLSANGTLSCAMCHIPEQGFAQNELATPVGFEGRMVRRNAPSLYNVAYRAQLFHDGRETGLEEQIWFPLLAANEMGNRSEQQVLERIGSIPVYEQQFRAAFGGAISRRTLGRALAGYQRVLLAADSPFDRWFFGGEQDALGADAKRGFDVFRNRGCSDCHLVGKDAALFSDGLFHDTGIAYREAREGDAIRRLQLAPGVVIDVNTDVLRPRPSDLGRMEVTADVADRWRYRTPTLRNIALTAPYMHNGSLPDLRAVLEYYAAGGAPHAGQDARIRPLQLRAGEIDELLAFLDALSASNVAALAADARSVEIGDFRVLR